MADIAIFVERYTLTRSSEVGAIMRFSHAAQRMGHRLDVLFRPDMYKIPQYDALFIRSMTDPLNSAYVASRMAQMHGLRVIDDPDSIIICCDKVNMYRHLMQHEVSMPQTAFLDRQDITPEKGRQLLDCLGSPIVLKAPNSSFSMYVEKASTPDEFVRVGKRFLRRADRVVAQRFVHSTFDWRVGVLAGEILYVCQYRIPKARWKILTYTDDGQVVYGRVKTFDVEKVDPLLLETARQAASAVGNGLYGIDIKQVPSGYAVIEVNDNPTIVEDEEDQSSPRLYERIIRYLVGEWG